MSNFDKRYIRLIEDLNWLKSDISGLVRLKCYGVARRQMIILKRLCALKLYVENLGSFPGWYDSIRRCY